MNATLDFWSGLLVGALIAALATGWAMEARLRVAEQRLWQQQVNGLVADQALLSDALKLAVPDPLTRALMGAQAVHEQAKRPKEQR